MAKLAPVGAEVTFTLTIECGDCVVSLDNSSSPTEVR
jgi:hypothetical protein